MYFSYYNTNTARHKHHYCSQYYTSIQALSCVYSVDREAKDTCSLSRVVWVVGQFDSMARPKVRFENQATKSYLVAYNLAQFVGWFFVFLKLVENINVTFDYRSTYAAVGGTVRKLQLIAFLEVLHAGFGLVRSDPQTAFMQWAGRTHVLVAIIDNLSEVQTNVSVFITFAAWSISEIVRYPQYGLSSLGMCPKWLTWLRYTMFIVLYPAGVSGEMLAMYLALVPIKDGKLSFKMFDYLPINYYSFIIVLLMVYPLLFLVLYLHMFKQRRSRLGPRREGAAKKTRRDK